MSDAAAEPGLRIDVNDPTNLPLVESSRFAVRAEELGFAGVGMPDHPHTGRDVFVRLALAAQRTERVTLFPSVANPVSRDPRMLATLAATLGELAPGRARLVVGSGQNAVQYVGVPGATVSQMAATTETVRRTLATEFALEPPVPVYINGSSPRMLEAAGAAADGVYAMVGVDPEVVAAAMEHVQAGAPRSGAGSRECIPVALGLPVFMAESAVRAYESAAEYAFSNLRRRNRVFSRVLRERMPSLADVSAVNGAVACAAARPGRRDGGGGHSAGGGCEGARPGGEDADAPLHRARAVSGRRPAARHRGVQRRTARCRGSGRAAVSGIGGVQHRRPSRSRFSAGRSSCAACSLPFL